MEKFEVEKHFHTFGIRESKEMFNVLNRGLLTIVCEICLLQNVCSTLCILPFWRSTEVVDFIFDSDLKFKKLFICLIITA